MNPIDLEFDPEWIKLGWYDRISDFEKDLVKVESFNPTNDIITVDGEDVALNFVESQAVRQRRSAKKLFRKTQHIVLGETVAKDLRVYDDCQPLSKIVMYMDAFRTKHLAMGTLQHEIGHIKYIAKTLGGYFKANGVSTFGMGLTALGTAGLFYTASKNGVDASGLTVIGLGGMGIAISCYGVGRVLARILDERGERFAKEYMEERMEGIVAEYPRFRRYSPDCR
jgi:hypothetical protein